MSARKYFAAHAEPPCLIVEVMQPVGSLADEDVLHELDLLLDAVKQQSPKAVIVNFHHVAYFGSSLLEALRALWRKIEPAGGRMVLCDLSTVGREIIELAKFDHVWTIAENVADAKQKLQAGGAL